MENVYGLYQHTHCVFIHIGKAYITANIVSTTNRHFRLPYNRALTLGTSISYNKQRTDTKYVGVNFEEDKEDIVIDSFRDGLYNLFKKDKETWDEEDTFLMKAVSDYLPLAVKETVKKMELQIETYDLFHYVFVVPSEWEEEIRDEIIRPIFVQSGLISKEDHQDRLLFYTDIESLCNREYFKRGQNTILCRIAFEAEETIIKFDLIRTTTTLFNFPNAKLFPKVMNSSSVSFTRGDIKRRIKVFLKKKLFPMVKADNDGIRESLNPKLILSDQDQIIEAIIEGIDSAGLPSLEEENKGKYSEKQPWITIKEDCMLSESQKEFINSLRPSIVCAEIGTFLLGYMKDIISYNFTKSYEFLLIIDDYNNEDNEWKDEIIWLDYILEYNRCSLNSAVTITTFKTMETVIDPEHILIGAGIGAFEAILHSDIYCKPHIVPSADLNISSAIFLNSKPDAIINLDISLGSTLFTCSILDEEGLIQEIFNHDYIIEDKHLPALGYFYTFSDRTILNVKERFIPFAERFLLGNLSDLIAENNVSIKNDLLLEMKALLTRVNSEGEVLVSINQQKYIKAFVLMYMIYIKEEILYKFFDKFIPDQMDMKIGYAVSIESMLLNKTMESKDNFRDIIYESGLVLKDDHSKKLRIITQGERILPAIQKSLELELSLKSYFLLCQIHEDYVQLTLHQVVTEPSPKEKEQESIIVQDEIIPIRNIYDSLCSTMWYNLLQDSSLIELCETHNTNDCSKILDLLSSKVKTEFFDNLKGYFSDNVLQNNPDMQSTDAVNLTSSCNCKVRLTTSDIIDISFTPVLQGIACTLSASLLNKELFGNYMNIDYLFSFIRFNNNPQLQYAFTKILEEKADDFNLELGIDTSCLIVPELFSQLLQPVIAYQPLCYKDFKIGALQQVYSENFVFSLNEGIGKDGCFIYKSKITDTKTIECVPKIVFPFLNKREIINNVQSNRKFYLRNKEDCNFHRFFLELYRFETINNLENNGTLSLDDNIYHRVDESSIYIGEIFALKDVDVPVMVSIRYVSYIASFQIYVKITGAEIGDKHLTGVIETGEPLTLARL